VNQTSLRWPPSQVDGTVAVRNVYLLNLSIGLAGTERRFANVWQTLKRRGNVRPILVVPEVLAKLLAQAGLVDLEDELLWAVPENPALQALGAIREPTLFRIVTRLRLHALAGSYRRLGASITNDPNCVIHVGIDTSALNPPPGPTVYECVDSTLMQLTSRHFTRAAQRDCIVHCQTGRIRNALESELQSRNPRWTTVTSPCYFASYPDTTIGVTRQPSLVAFVGRFSSEKQPLLFVDAIAEVRRQGVECRAVMLGQGPLLGELRRRVQEIGLADVIEIGFTTRPLLRLAQSAIYVTLQSGDNYGSQSMLEAMGAGCAIIATDVGETERIITPDVGLTIQGSIPELADALIQLLKDPSRTAQMGAAASDLARTEYSADRYAAFLETLYSMAVEKYRANGSRRTAEHV
jgi:glycosyltransferase involved in cell wall biosynthesis